MQGRRATRSRIASVSLKRSATLEILQKGRWQTVQSLRRYAKTGALQKVLHRLPLELRTFGRRAREQLEDVMHERTAAERPRFPQLPVVSLVQ